MKYINTDTKKVFAFCKACWEFKCFSFEKLISEASIVKAHGKCETCESTQSINVEDVKKYYEKLSGGAK